MNNLLRPLLDAIETVRTRISNHRTYLESDERRTRVSLVDPILHALGWDPSDPESVALEWKIEGGESADYALLGDDGNPVTIVEAKKLGTSLGRDPRRQTGGYVLGANVDLAALTDGDHWNIYDLRRAGSGDAVARVTISTGEPNTTALELLDLWRPQVRLQRQKSQPPRPIEAGETSGADVPGPAPMPARPPTEHNNWIPLDKIPAGPEADAPASIRIADGDPVSLSDWPDLQVHVVLWLYREGDLTRVSVPYQHKRKAKPFLRHQTGDSGWQWRPVPETTLEVSTVGTSQAVLDRVKELLRACGHHETSVHARLHG